MAVSQPFLNTILTLLIFLTAYLFYVNSLDSSFASLSSNISDSASDITLLDTIPHHLIPSPHNDRRLIVVGDIHGMLHPLEALLEKVGFDPERDHLVATGDMISKGPESGGVVDKLIALNASAVRGNHEDHILKARAKMDRRRKEKKQKHHRSILSFFSSKSNTYTDHDDEPMETKAEDNDIHEERAKARDRKTARSLKKHHISWLRSLPIIISLEPILPIYIVHAGLVPGLQVTKQDPWAVMNMRTLRFPKHRALLDDQQPLQPNDDEQYLVPCEDSLVSEEEEDVEGSRQKNPIPTDGRSGQRWADVWNKYQRHIPKKKRRAVIYGHDAKRGHRVGEYTFGLDSGCVAGGKLTAVVLEGGAWDGEYRHKAVQISC